MNVIAFPTRHVAGRGTLHVLPTEDGLFEVGHESASGNSWAFHGPFDTASDAVRAANGLNRRQYGGGCEVYISQAAGGAA